MPKLIHMRRIGFLLVLVSLALGGGCQGKKGEASAPSEAGQVARGNVPEELRGLVVGRVGDQTVTLGDLQDKIAIQYASLLELEGLDDVKQKQQILNLYIEELCWNELGKKLGFDKTPRYEKTVEYARRYVLSDLVLKEYVGKRAEPPEEQILAYYEENQDKFAIPRRAITRHIMTQTREKAEEARQQLIATGGDWDKVAKQYSIEKTTGTRGGFVGAVTLDNDILGLGEVPEFNAKVLSMKEGEYSEPFQTSKGWHVAFVEEFRPKGTKPLEEVHKLIYDRLMRESAFAVRKAVMDSLQAALKVETYQDALDAYMMEVVSGEDLLRLARRTDEGPEKKIKLYEALLRRMPESPSCAEAQFMIGFVYAEELGDENAAREALQQVLEKYPDSELVSSARRLLDSLNSDSGAAGGD